MKTHEEVLPAYEDLAHMVRRIVREELQPVFEELRALREESDRSQDDGRVDAPVLRIA